MCERINIVSFAWSIALPNRKTYNTSPPRTRITSVKILPLGSPDSRTFTRPIAPQFPLQRVHKPQPPKYSLRPRPNADPSSDGRYYGLRFIYIKRNGGGWVVEFGEGDCEGEAAWSTATGGRKENKEWL